MAGIPPTLETDGEDVAWALQTAEALWKRHERLDAVVWLRRAAQAAGDADDDDRALALARNAAELADWLTRRAATASAAVSPAPAASPASVGQAADELAASDEIDGSLLSDEILEEAEPEDEVAFEGGARDIFDPRPEAAMTDRATDAGAAPGQEEDEEEVTSRHASSVPPGRPNRVLPASAQAFPSAVLTLPLPPPMPPPSVSGVLARVAISIHPPQPQRIPSPLPQSPAAPASSERSLPAAPSHVPTAAEAHAGILDPWAESEGARAQGPAETRGVDVAPASRGGFDSEEVVTSAPPFVRRNDVARPLGPTAAAPIAPRAPLDFPSPLAEPLSDPVDLSAVEALSDLPDDARRAFARRAKLRTLDRGDEVAGFAVLLLLEGTADVASTLVDTPAHTIDAGTVLRTRGTIDAAAKPVRVIAARDRVRIATWDERDVADVLRTCPWVEDELRSAGNRTQALIGVTLGPLGERLDPVLRASVTGRMSLRVLAEHEVFARAGAPIPGLLVVAAGELELIDVNGLPTGQVVRTGEFLFPGEVLRAAPAPYAVRAARGGALIFTAERGIAHELLVTCPPLLELFAEG